MHISNRYCNTNIRRTAGGSSSPRIRCYETAQLKELQSNVRWWKTNMAFLCFINSFVECFLIGPQRSDSLFLQWSRSFRMLKSCFMYVSIYLLLQSSPKSFFVFFLQYFIPPQIENECHTLCWPSHPCWCNNTTMFSTCGSRHIAYLHEHKRTFSKHLDRQTADAAEQSPVKQEFKFLK